MLLLKVSAESFHIHFTGPIQNKSIIAFDVMKFDNFIVFVERHYNGLEYDFALIIRHLYN